jgi:hypothetical protein
VSLCSIDPTKHCRCQPDEGKLCPYGQFVLETRDDYKRAWKRLEGELAAKEAEVQRLREDAERYRWLRTWTSAGYSMPGSPAEFRLPHLKAPANVMRGSVVQHLDAAIDRARVALKGEME